MTNFNYIIYDDGKNEVGLGLEFLRLPHWLFITATNSNIYVLFTDENYLIKCVTNAPTRLRSVSLAYKKLLILLLFNSGLPADGSEEALANNSWVLKWKKKNKIKVGVSGRVIFDESWNRCVEIIICLKLNNICSSWSLYSSTIQGGRKWIASDEVNSFERYNSPFFPSWKQLQSFASDEFI